MTDARRVGIWLSMALSIAVGGAADVQACEGSTIECDQIRPTDCTDPKNQKSIYADETNIPNNPKAPFAARITVLKTTPMFERDRTARGAAPIDSPYKSLMVHIDQVLRGPTGFDEAEITGINGCITSVEQLPGATGIVVGIAKKTPAGFWMLVVSKFQHRERP